MRHTCILQIRYTFCQNSLHNRVDNTAFIHPRYAAKFRLAGCFPHHNQDNLKTSRDKFILSNVWLRLS